MRGSVFGPPSFLIGLPSIPTTLTFTSTLRHPSLSRPGHTQVTEARDHLLDMLKPFFGSSTKEIAVRWKSCPPLCGKARVLRRHKPSSGIVLVCEGCHNKIPWAGWLKQQSFTVSQCRGWKSWIKVPSGLDSSKASLLDLQSATLSHGHPSVHVCPPGCLSLTERAGMLGQGFALTT